MIALIVRAAAVVATLSGIAYWLFTLLCARRFVTAKRRAATGGATPPVSILKPLCGLEPQAYESLRSHCLQDYPEFEIIFGVKEPQDPIAPIVERLMNEFPHIRMRLVICPKTLGMNFKVSNLIQMLPEATHSHIVINDSDIHVPVDYLRRVMAPLDDETVGMVTCLYRGLAADSLGSRLESLSIDSDFMPGVIVASQMEGVQFALGSTLAFRRSALDSIGGLNALVDYLADDYQFGNRISRSGLKVVISDCVVEHQLPRYSIRAFFQHQLRWGRTVRSARPGGYAGYLLTFTVPWSLIALAMLHGSPLGWALLFSSIVLRDVVSVVYGIFVLEDRASLRNIRLLPIRDCVAVALWIACYAGRRVVWRGNTFELANGKLRPA